MLRKGALGSAAAVFRRGGGLRRAHNGPLSASRPSSQSAEQASASTSNAAAAAPPAVLEQAGGLAPKMAPKNSPEVRQRVFADLKAEFPVRSELLAASSVYTAAAASQGAAAARHDRLMAHMLLLCSEPSPGDLANPARWGSITYADLLAAEAAGNSPASLLPEASASSSADIGTDGESDGFLGLLDGAEQKKAASGAASAPAGATATPVAASNSEKKSRLDEVFDGLLEGLESGGGAGGSVPKGAAAGAAAPSASAKNSSVSVSNAQKKPGDEDEAWHEVDASGRRIFGARRDAAGFDASVDSSPCVLGGFGPSSLTRYDGISTAAVPSSGVELEAGPAALGTAWLELAIGHLEAIAARLKRHAEAASKALSSSPLVSLTGEDGKHAEAVLSALTSIPSSPVAPAQAAWLAALPKDKLNSLMTHLLLRRRGLSLPLSTGSGGGAADVNIITPRIKALESAAGVLRTARDGQFAVSGDGIKGWPTLRQLHSALTSAVGGVSGGSGSGIPVFTPLRSAAAALATRFRNSLVAEQQRIDEGIAKARAMREAFLASVSSSPGSSSSSGPVPRYTIQVPSVDALLTAPGYALDDVSVAISGSTVSADDGTVTVQLAPAHSHLRAIHGGNLPAALSPLASALTPSEHAALSEYGLGLVMSTRSVRFPPSLIAR